MGGVCKEAMLPKQCPIVFVLVHALCCLSIVNQVLSPSVCTYASLPKPLASRMHTWARPCLKETCVKRLSTRSEKFTTGIPVVHIAMLRWVNVLMKSVIFFATERFPRRRGQGVDYVDAIRYTWHRPVGRDDSALRHLSEPRRRRLDTVAIRFMSSSISSRCLRTNAKRPMS